MNKYERYEANRVEERSHRLGIVTGINDIYAGAVIWDNHHRELGIITEVRSTQHGWDISWVCPSGSNSAGRNYFMNGHHIEP